MTAPVVIEAKGDHRYAVTIGDSHHDVGVPPALTEALGLSDDDEEGLVRISFEFLLEREPPSSILKRFDLDVIGRYFPDYPEAVRSRLGPG
ncbi:MAG: hypothetical protein ACRDYY_15655 [Acidimicrobiales bacterium]